MRHSHLASLLLQPQPEGLNFGHAFTEPTASLEFGNLVGSAQPGIYAILAYDPNWGPRPNRPLHLGGSQDVCARATARRESYAGWQRHAGPCATLYRAFHIMTGRTQKQRQAVESSLIARFNPPCNQKLSLDISRCLKRH
jgi:hypothetical protein